MKKALLIIMFLIVTISFVNAQSQKDDQNLARETIINFFDKLAKLDTAALKLYATKDFLLLEDGAVWNLDSLNNKINKMRAVTLTRVNHLNFIQTEVKGNIAWAAYHNEADMSINGQKMNIEWLESAVLVKEGTGLKIRLLHSTIIKPH